MSELSELDSHYSTRCNIVCQKPVLEGGSEGKFEIVLFLPKRENLKGEGGLRTQGFFKSSQEGKPLITIVTVVYNGEQYLEGTVLSIIEQSYDNVEYIIIDGGSTDGTLDIIRKYENVIDYWISEKDEGIYDAMNKGIQLASGGWINFMNAGDCFYTKNILKKIFSEDCLEGTDIIYGNHQVHYLSGRKRSVKAGEIKKIWKGSQFCHQASFTRTSYHKQFKFNTCSRIIADFEFFYRAWKKEARFMVIPLIVTSFEAGGISDVKRIDSILGWWSVVEKSPCVNFYYIYLIVKEMFKEKIKNAFF